MTKDEMQEIVERIDEQAAATQRHFDVVAESLDVKIETIAEGHGIIIGKIDGLETRMGGLETRMDGLETRMSGLETRMDGLETRMDGLETRMGGLETRLDAFIVETRTNFEEVRAAVKFSYAELDRRVSHLETFVMDLSKRLERLEVGKGA